MENFFKKNGYWAVMAKWLAMGISLIYVCSRFVPSFLTHNVPPDDSWTQTLHVAFARHWQFGRDVIFTFGPWGFLCGGYYPPTFEISVIAWGILSVVFWLGCCRLAYHSFARPSVVWLWLMGFFGVAGLPVTQNIDIRQAAWVLILLSLHFFAKDNSFSIVKILLVVSLGCLGLTKFTGMIMTAAIIFVIAVDEIARHRRFPWIVLVFVGSVLGFWIAAGQRLNMLLPFFSNSWQLTSGYTEAMMWGGNREDWAIFFFLLAATAAALPAVYAGFVKHRHWGILPAAGLGFIILMVFKHSFVRYDDHHEIVAALAVLLIALTSLAVSWPLLQNKGPQIIVMELLLLDGALIYAAVLFNLCTPGKKFLEQFAETLRPHSILLPVELLYGPGDLHAKYEENLAAIREKHPLPEVKGDVDVYPWNQMVVFANGLHYRPRPIFQSYSAYTPKLEELNAAYLYGKYAPENILFDIESIDSRFPSLDDGCSWPELLTRYNINKVTGDFVLLKRSAVPRKYHLVPLTEIPIHFGEWVELPAVTDAPIWAEIKIDNTLWGTIARTFYKPPTLDLTVSLRKGGHFTYRLIPDMARSGFLLSPLINDKESFVALALVGEEHNLNDEEVTSLKIFADTSSGSTVCYRSPMRLCLYRLDFPRQIPAGPESEKTSLNETFFPDAQIRDDLN